MKGIDFGAYDDFDDEKMNYNQLSRAVSKGS
jgi:hypothetical protein